MSAPHSASAKRVNAPMLAVLGAGMLAAGALCGGSVRWLTFLDHPPSIPQDAGDPARITGVPAWRVAPASGQHFTTRLGDLASVASPTKRARLVGEIADDLDASAVREALDALEKQSVRDAKEIRLHLLARWAELEPTAALKYAAALPGGFEAPGAITAVIQRWAEMDPEAAENEVAQMPEGFARTVARTALLPALSESDPAHAFELFQAGTPFCSDQISVFFQNWAESNPEDAAAHAAQLPATWQATFALRDVMTKWAETDRDAALAWASSWQPANPPGVTIERRDPGPLTTILRTWMNEEPTAALQWLEQMPDETARSDLLAALSGALSSTDPRHAVEVAAMMPAGKSQDTALRRLIGQWAQKDFAGALDWARQQPDEEVRQNLLPALADDLAQRDTTAGLELALSVGGEAGTRSVERVLRAWAQREPAMAAKWVSAQPENADYISQLAFGWAQKDRAAALEWASTIPSGPAKDTALASGARMMAQSDQPRIAADWIALMSAEKRSAAYHELAFWWLRSDPKQARAWIETSPLSARDKAELLKKKSP